MNKLSDYMLEAKTFYLATTADQKPSVRPIGGKPAFDEPGFVQAGDKIYFYTDSTKPMYRQMKENPDIALTFLVAAGFVRVSAKAAFEDNADIKRRMLDENKSLTQLYKEDDGIFQVYSLQDVKAFLYAKGQAPIELT
jgi:uncharacterized pyridoxamine 5'-phosphate oxidase family protein